MLAGNGPVFSAGHDFADVVDADLPGPRAAGDLHRADDADPAGAPAGGGPGARAGYRGRLQLVASADLAVASEDAGFAAPGGKGGWFCHTPMVAIARNVGRKRAAELAFSGDVIDARPRWTGAWSTGSSPPPSSTPPPATCWSGSTRGSAESKGIGKQALYAQIDLDQAKAYAYAIEVMAATSQLPDARGMIDAFLEKRKPNFDR